MISFLNTLKMLDTYTERSVSGDGLHFIFFYESALKASRSDTAKLYFESRFLAFTGDIYGTPKDVRLVGQSTLVELRERGGGN